MEIDEALYHLNVINWLADRERREYEKRMSSE
jgi:hypothetical protein